LDVAARLGSSWPAAVHCFTTLESTSDWLKARRGAAPWTVAWAQSQTRGRGRLGRRWHSSPGNLALSVVLPVDERVPLGLVPLAAGVAVAEALAGWGARTQLKWPNDVLIGERKAAGVLAESSSSGATPIDNVVLGIGVNLVEAPSLDEDSLPAPIAVCEATVPPGLAQAGVDVLRQVAVWYDALVREPQAVRNAWRTRCVNWWGEPVEWQAGSQQHRGRVVALRDDGALWLELDDGRREAVFSGEIRQLRRSPA
jgi:BirA family transcriptional regulator, biotin operon repressor / biotin---[acetyl-CoA-carboxylase] ligase